jgi:hypothetical protein
MITSVYCFLNCPLRGEGRGVRGERGREGEGGGQFAICCVKGLHGSGETPYKLVPNIHHLHKRNAVLAAALMVYFIKTHCVF